MKKVFWMLLMICAVGAFTACSDDDNEGVTNPISNPKVQAQGEVGGEVTITGTGFTANSKIFMKDVNEKLTAVQVKTASETKVVVIIPETLVAGVYKVVLQQGGDWELGTITLTSKSPITGYAVPAKVIRGTLLEIAGAGFADNCEVYLKPVLGDAINMGTVTKVENGITVVVPVNFTEGTYTVVLKQEGEWKLGTTEVIAEQRVVIEMQSVEKAYEDDQLVETMPGEVVKTTIKYDVSGKVKAIHRERTSLDENWEITYTDNSVSIAVSGMNEDEPIENTITFTLENGRVTHSTELLEGTEYTWRYTEAGYLEIVTDDGAEGEMVAKYGYDGSDINTCEYSGFSAEFSYDVSEAKLNNQSGVDLFACLTEYVGFPELTSIARMLGICGKYPVHMPKAFESVNWGNFAISYGETSGAVSSIVLTSRDEEEDGGVIFALETEITYTLTY